MEINVDDVESFRPLAGSKLPSKITTGYFKGLDVDVIFKRMDYEDMLKEISTHPVAQRKALLRMWYQRQR